MFWNTPTIVLEGFDSIDEVESELLDEERQRTMKSKAFIEQLFQLLEDVQHSNEEIMLSSDEFQRIRNLSSNLVRLWKDDQIRHEIIPFTTLEDQIPDESEAPGDVDLGKDRKKAKELKRQAVRIEVLHDIADKTMQVFLYEFPHEAENVNQQHLDVLEKELAAFTTLTHSYRYARQANVNRRMIKQVLNNHLETVLEEFNFTISLNFDGLLPKDKDQGKIEEALEKLDDLVNQN